MVSLSCRKIISVTELLTLKVLFPKPGMEKFLFCQTLLQFPLFERCTDLSGLGFSVSKMTSSYKLLFLSADTVYAAS